MRATAGEANHNHVLVPKLKKQYDSTMIWYSLARALCRRTHAHDHSFFQTFNEIRPATAPIGESSASFPDSRPSAAVQSLPGRCTRAKRGIYAREKRIRAGNALMNKTNGGLGVALLQDRRLRADVHFIRTRSAIRADGTPAAQARSKGFQASTNVADRLLRAARANPVFHTDEKRIRMENRVLDKSKVGLVLIQDRRQRRRSP